MTAEWNYESDDNNTKAADFSKKNSRSRSKSPGDVFQSTESGSNDIPKETSNRSKTNPTPEPSTCIGIFGLSKKTDEKTLWKTFENFGKIKSVSLIVDKFTKESLGFAFINYEELDSATGAIKETNGMTLDSKTIRVDYSITKKAYTPTPGSGYKGKNISRRVRNTDKRNFKRKRPARSRSRSIERKHSAMKYLNGRNSPVNNLTCSRAPMDYSESRSLQMRYEARRNSPVSHYSRQYSPQRNREYSSPRHISRGYSPMAREYRGYSPERIAKRGYYSHVYESRGYSPVRTGNRSYSPPKSLTKEYSPPRNHIRGYSPFRNEYRGYSPARIAKMGCSSMHHEIRDYSPKKVREFSPARTDNVYPFRNGIQVYSPVKNNLRSYSPVRKDIRVYSPMNRETTPVRIGYRHSPDRIEKFKDSATINENQRFFY